MLAVMKLHYLPTPAWGPRSDEMNRAGVLLWMIVLIAAAARVDAQSTTAPATNPARVFVTPPANQMFDIYLLMGQSNMVGRDTARLAAQVENPHVLAMNADGKWFIAKNPIHDDARTPVGTGP